MKSSGRDRAHQVNATESNSSLADLIGHDKSSKPIGISLFGLCFKFSSQDSKRTYYKTLTIILTFIAYAAFHMGRRPLSVAKNVLHRDCAPTQAPPVFTQQPPLASALTTSSPPALEHNFVIDVGLGSTLMKNDTNIHADVIIAPSIHDTSCNWAPFDDDATANQLLGWLDTSFLLAYAIFMFFSGMVAERMNLRYFISIGAIISGLGLVAFGLAKDFDIHSMSYFVAIQIISGAAQTTGWPVVVTCISNWFEPSNWGLVYGLWNSHTSLGNILGASIAGFYVEKDWGLSFIVPGVIMIVVGVILALFLVPLPIDVGLEMLPSNPNQADSISRASQATSITSGSISGVTELNLKSTKASTDQMKPASFLTALKIPGVLEFSMCLFFSKLVSYTFLYWLPKYIKSSTSFDSEDAAYLSIPFDVGGIAGAILAGYLSDLTKMNGLVCEIMLLLAIPSLFVYETFGAYSKWHNIVLQLIAGALVNGPYCLITTAVSADLGNRIKDERAMSTVSAIIDGMGSVGAVVGPLFAGFVSDTGSWQAVFIMLMLSDVFAFICLIRITINEVKGKFSRSAQVTQVNISG